MHFDDATIMRTTSHASYSGNYSYEPIYGIDLMCNNSSHTIATTYGAS